MVSFVGRPVSLVKNKPQHAHETIPHKANDGVFEANSDGNSKFFSRAGNVTKIGAIALVFLTTIGLEKRVPNICLGA